MENWATKEGFFKAQVPREKVTVQGLGDVWIYGLTCGQKDEYEDTVMQFNAGSREVSMSNARAVLMKMTVHDQHGRLLFSDKDMGRLGAVPSKIVDPILIVARKLSGMATGEIEELVKNSETAQGQDSDGSDSESPGTSAGVKPKSEPGSAHTS